MHALQRWPSSVGPRKPLRSNVLRPFRLHLLGIQTPIPPSSRWPSRLASRKAQRCDAGADGTDREGEGGLNRLTTLSLTCVENSICI